MVMQAASMALHGRRGPPTVQMAPYRSSKVVPAGKHILDTQSTVKQGRRAGMITMSHLGLSCALLSFPGALLSCAGVLLSCAGVPLFLHSSVAGSYCSSLWLILTLSLSPCSFSDSLSVYLLSLFAAVSDTAISTGEWSI